MQQLGFVRGVPILEDSAAPGIPIPIGNLDGGTFLFSLGAKVLDNQDMYFDVLNFGGAVGNGIANDTAAIQNCINAIAAVGGGRIYFPRGTYLITSINIISNNVLLFGEGTSTIFKSVSNLPIIKVDNCQDITLRDFAILGDADPLKTQQRGIQCINVSNSFVNNIHVDNVGYDGILLLSGCNSNRIIGNHLDGCKDDGINIGGDPIAACSDNIVESNTVNGCLHTGIHVSEASIRTTVGNNTVTNCSNGIDLYKTRSVTISNNTIRDCTNFGIDNPQGPNTDVVISGNIIDGCLRGIYLRSNASRFTIKGNNIRDCVAYGILLSESPAFNSDSVVSNNIISGLCATSAIHLSGVRNVIVEGNNILNATNDGIYVKSLTGFECSFIEIINNHFRNTTGSSIEVEGGGLSNHITIRGNEFRDCAGRCIEYRGGVNFIISDNRCADSSDFAILISAAAQQDGLGQVQNNKVVGGATSEGIRINNYNEVMITGNSINNIAGAIGISSLIGFGNQNENNFSDKTISGGLQNRTTLFDNFIGPTISNQWNVLKGTDLQAVNFAVLAGQSKGVIRGTTGDDIAATMAVNGVQIDSALNWRANNGGLRARFKIALTSIAGVALYLGFTDQVGTLEMPFTMNAAALTSNTSNGCGFLFDTDSTVDNWKLVGCASDVDAAVQDAGVAPSAGSFEIVEVEISLAGLARFYRNGAPIGAIMTGAVNPATLLTPAVVGFARAAALKNFDVDFIKVDSNT